MFHGGDEGNKGAFPQGFKVVFLGDIARLGVLELFFPFSRVFCRRVTAKFKLAQSWSRQVKLRGKILPRKF